MPSRLRISTIAAAVFTLQLSEIFNYTTSPMPAHRMSGSPLPANPRMLIGREKDIARYARCAFTHLLENPAIIAMWEQKNDPTKVSTPHQKHM